MPRGKIHKFVYGSSFQSIDLAVITVPSKPLYTTRVQASVRDKAATDKISDKPNATLSGLIFRFFAILGCYTAKSEPKNASNSPINDYIRTAFPEICINMRKFAVTTCSAFR